MPRTFTLLLLAVGCVPHTLAGQRWNADDAIGLVARATARRAADRDAGLQDFRAQAHGFVFFLAQLGEEQLQEPPRLVKSDQLELEVYWSAAGGSKQRIVGWRERVDLPTDIRYHRDHLGIVQNGFADHIRLGEGDEVRDVPHPLAPGSTTLYDFAVVDSLTITLPHRAVRVVELAFRPKSFDEPRIVGSLLVDVTGGELVQLRFNFTRAAYRDESLEDITVLLENALWEGQWWLPRRQEIEIRRRATYLELPARGIIRGRWMIDGYEFNPGVAPATFLGPEIDAAPQAVRDSFPWSGSLDSAVQAAAGPVTTLEMDDVRARVRSITQGRLLTGLPTASLAVGSLSDLLHFNKVEGFAPGLGVGFRTPGGTARLRGWVSYGISDERLKGRLAADYHLSPVTIGLRATRLVRDFADEPVIAPLLNSFLAQELGNDAGHYVLVEGLFAALRGGGAAVRVGVERIRSVKVRAAPAAGTFSPNPPLGEGTWALAVLGLGSVSRAPGGGRVVEGRASLEAGLRDTEGYVRLVGAGAVEQPAGPTTVRITVRGGWGSSGLPAHRTFAIGGRGTLVGEPYRAWGGRATVLGRLEWRVPIPVPAIPLGPFTSTGRRVVVAPFLALGWAGGAAPGVPWQPSDGARPVLGVGVEPFHRLLRVELGWAPRRGHVGMTVDLRSDLWNIL